jgi:hypothetical protein
MKLRLHFLALLSKAAKKPRLSQAQAKKRFKKRRLLSPLLSETCELDARKRHVKARNLLSAASPECIVGGNEPSTTSLTSAALISAYITAKNIATWSSQG